MTKETSFDQAWAARFETLIEGPGTGADQAEDAKFSVLLGHVPELLLPGEMADADKLAMQAGTAGMALMEMAGLAVAEAVRSARPDGGRISVLTGPGNNGGDGFVVARLLAEAGYQVTVWMQSSREQLTGDAAFAAASWTGTAKGLSASVPADADLIVDAMFGAGLSKPITGLTAGAIEAINESDVPVISIDLPSGIEGAGGQVLGCAIKAQETVTFFRKKPGHLLYPGRAYCGRVTLADIGIEAGVLDIIKPKARVNHPDSWTLPDLEVIGHKYSRGHTVVLAGPPQSTGAARLAARGALRAGSGLVTVAAPTSSVHIVAAQVTAIMVKEIAGPPDLAAMLEDERLNAVVLGPALGVGAATRNLVDAAIGSSAALVLDADALVSFGETPDALFEKLKAREAGAVITPHDGEFAKLFGDTAGLPSKLGRARRAAALSGAVVVCKGPDTVIAAPDGRAFINDNAPPQLATAGSGDVLAGIIGGLLAQGMAPLEAAAAGVWLHGAAGQSRGHGLIAEDLPEALPDVFAARGG
ncbi:MAG: NAD(P)H-hydrate dehydratase [Alphaproteobacteria bacterium]